MQANWQTLIAEDEHDVLEWASCVSSNRLVLCYLHDVKVCRSLCLLLCFLPFTSPLSRLLVQSWVVDEERMILGLSLGFSFQCFDTDATASQLLPLVCRIFQP